MLKFGGTARVVVGVNRTGREILLQDENYELTKKIDEYIRSGLETLISVVDSEVINFSEKYTNGTIIFYRGIHKCKRKLVQSNILGPNPNMWAQRYNENEQKALYLADSSYGVGCELKRKKVWYEQKYIINTSKYRIANIDNNYKIDSLLAILFFISENGMTIDGKKIRKVFQGNPYGLSQLLSNAFRKYNWDGLYIPGVWGQKDKNYRNIVLWNEVYDNYREYAEGDCYLHI